MYFPLKKDNWKLKNLVLHTAMNNYVFFKFLYNPGIHMVLQLVKTHFWHATPTFADLSSLPQIKK